jgi:hypothetical protein
MREPMPEKKTILAVDDVYDDRTQIDKSYFPYDRWLNKPVKADLLLNTVREI